MAGKQRPPKDPCLTCGKGEHRGRYHTQLSRPDFHHFKSSKRAAQQAIWLEIAARGARRISHDISCAMQGNFGDCSWWVISLLEARVPISVIDAEAAPILKMIDDHCQGLRW